MGEKPHFSTHPRNFPFCFLWGSCAKTPPTLPSSPVAKNHLHNHSPQRTWMAAFVKFEKDVAKHLCVLVCGHIWIRLCTSTCTWTCKPAILLTNEFLTKNNTCSRVPSSAHKPWHPAVSHLFPGSAQCCWLNPTQFRPAIVGQSTRCSTAQRPRTMGWISDTITRPCEEQIQHEVLCGGRLLAILGAFPLDSIIYLQCPCSNLHGWSISMITILDHDYPRTSLKGGTLYTYVSWLVDCGRILTLPVALHLFSVYEEYIYTYI